MKPLSNAGTQLSLIGIIGFLVMAVEVLTKRLLTPYFGTDSPTLEHLLAVVLLSTAAGYLASLRTEWRADGPASSRLFQLCALLTYLHGAYIRFLADRIASGLIVFWLAGFPLFFVLGLNYSILARSTNDSEKRTLHISIASSIGGVAGSYSLYLLTRFGGMTLSQMLSFLAVLSLSGSFAGAARRSRTRTRLAETAALLATAAAFPSLRDVPAEPGLVFERVTPNSQIRVVDKRCGDAPCRKLYIGNKKFPQAEVLLNASKESQLVYDQAFADLQRLYVPRPRKILILGLGSGAVLRDLMRSMGPRFDQVDIDVVDLEPELLAVARKYFDLPHATPRVQYYFGDARRFLRDRAERYDVIFYDLMGPVCLVEHLLSQEFAGQVFEHLAEGGLMLTQAYVPFKDGAGNLSDSLLVRVKTLRQVVPQAQLKVFDVYRLAGYETGFRAFVFAVAREPATFTRPAAPPEPRLARLLLTELSPTLFRGPAYDQLVPYQDEINLSSRYDAELLNAVLRDRIED